MKKLAAILLVLLLAFNWLGYRLLMNLLEQDANYALQQRLDSEQYDESNLVEIKIPVNLPYLSNWSSYEKIQGETQIEGIHYKYVKRKLVNDTLILVCVPHTEKNQLRTAESDYFKQVNDLPNNGKKSGPAKHHSSKTPTADYLLKETTIEMAVQDANTEHYSIYFDKLSIISRLVAEQPPDC